MLDARHHHGDSRSRLWHLTPWLIVAGFILLPMKGVTYSFTQTEVQSGARIYKRQCARCHGANGEGKDNQFKGLRAPELIGPAALPCKPRPYQKIRQHDFRTAADVYAFVSATMPADQPAILDADEYWDVIAYLLQENGKKTDEARLDKSSSSQIVLHSGCVSTLASGSQRAQP